MKSQLWFLGFLLLLAGCNGDGVRQKMKDWVGDMQGNDKFRNVHVKQYVIGLPGYLNEYKKLESQASLKYANPYKEFYVLVLDETKDNVRKALGTDSVYSSVSDSALFDTYSRIIIKRYLTKSSSLKNTQYNPTSINNKQSLALTYESWGVSHEIYHDVAFINGDMGYYQIFMWCLASDKEKYRPVMEQIIQSFHEN